jgi:cysteine desulfurase
MREFLNFDHAAATTVRPEAWAAVEGLKKIEIANPSAVHTLGRHTKGLIDEARINLSASFMVKPEELIFTSGATEAVHAGIIGAYLGLKKKRGVVYTSPLVHSCVTAALNFLATHHGVTIKFLPILPSGHLDLEAINDRLIGESDLMVTEHLNSEIGVLQPVAKLGKKIIRWADENKQSKPIFMVDAAASAVTESVGLDFQKCDLLSLSGEKIGGLSGAGILLKRSGLKVASLIGGSQEWGGRGGTENVVGIVALAAAYKAHHLNLDSQNERLNRIKECLIDSFKTSFPDYALITPTEGSGLHILTILSPDTPAHLLVAQADLAGVALSAGSACSSGSIEGSSVLSALEFEAEKAARGFRISWGWSTTVPEAKALIEKLKAFL